MSDPVLAFVGVLIGAGVAAVTSLITALVTAKLAEGRETRARLFDVRRETYAEALRAAGLLRHGITDPLPEDAVVDMGQVAMFMAQLELLGSADVHRAYGELIAPSVEAAELRLAAQTDAEVDALFSSQKMQQLMSEIGDAEVKLRDLMRKDLGGKPLGAVDVHADRARAPGETNQAAREHGAT